MSHPQFSFLYKNNVGEESPLLPKCRVEELQMLARFSPALNALQAARIGYMSSRANC